jgi:hydroxypyruvate isomerase
MKDCIRMIRALKGTIFCIVPVDCGKVKPLASAAEEWQWVVEGLKEVAEFAQENDVVPGVEPLNRFETYLINRHDQAMQLADEVGHGLRVVLDAFHINIEEKDPIGAIKAVGSRMLDFHVATTIVVRQDRASTTGLKCSSAMKESGYDGHLTAEFVLAVGSHAARSVRRKTRKRYGLHSGRSEIHPGQRLGAHQRGRVRSGCGG